MTTPADPADLVPHYERQVVEAAEEFVAAKTNLGTFDTRVGAEHNKLRLQLATYSLEDAVRDLRDVRDKRTLHGRPL